ncbi:hypothetical protein CAPTEDRAFT_107377 [Capitella teleta]|uniref:Uncharacterized protein n=1 Tax=Capitella teleta TaxID=283909 RepID=R7U4I4_CAPTE|nr:hypothetical protein CAPTEDRAFT_107377 [Capitella teleta]|eukprot:ELU01006.1 hypothetical protein CAPTEDRAFT_107377 [Capitella teleta]
MLDTNLFNNNRLFFIYLYSSHFILFFFPSFFEDTSEGSAPVNTSSTSSSSTSSSPSLQFLKPSVSHLDPQRHPLHLSALTGDLAELKSFLTNQNPPFDINQSTETGTTPIYCAAANGHSACLSLLLDRGADVNISRVDHTSPLHVSAAEGHINCLQQLLMLGADVTAADHNQWTPLHWAAALGRAECCSVLLDRGARLDALNNVRDCLLPLIASHLALTAGQLDAAASRYSRWSSELRGAVPLL